MSTTTVSSTIRLLLLTQYFRPEIGAAQTRLAETVDGLLARDFSVDVLAPAPSYPSGVVPDGYRRWLPDMESVDGVRLIRLPSVIVPGSRMSRRIVGQGSFALSALSAVAVAGRYDVALVESPPLLLGIPARFLHAAGLPYVLHVADPWPDFPIELGYLKNPFARRAAFALEAFAYAGASAITTVSPPIVDLLNAKPAARGRVTLVPNTVDVGRFAADQGVADRRTVRARLRWDERFTAVYVGTVGLAQGLDTLISAAAMLDDSIAIRIVGDGVERPELERRVGALQLTNVTFHEPVASDEVPAILAAADAGLVMLRRGALFDSSLPTKLLEAMAAARPVVVSADGITRDVVQGAQGGYVAPAEDEVALAAALRACQQDPDRIERGRHGHAYVVANYDRHVAIDRLARTLRAVSHQSRPRPG